MMMIKVEIKVKPVVHYLAARFHKSSGSKDDLGWAYVLPIDHPSKAVSNTTWAKTSPIIRFIEKNGYEVGFETQNTIYELAQASQES